MAKQLSEIEVQHFVDSYIGSFFFDYYTENERSKIGMISAHSQYEDRPYWGDCSETISIIKKAIELVPPVPENIVIYRGCCIHDRKFKRQFVSASFSRETAFYFANYKRLRLHKIIVSKGARIIPLCAVRKGKHMDPEYEIIVDSYRIKNRLLYCRYS